MLSIRKSEKQIVLTNQMLAFGMILNFWEFWRTTKLNSKLIFQIAHVAEPFWFNVVTTVLPRMSSTFLKIYFCGYFYGFCHKHHFNGMLFSDNHKFQKISIENTIFIIFCALKNLGSDEKCTNMSQKFTKMTLYDPAPVCFDHFRVHGVKMT